MITKLINMKSWSNSLFILVMTFAAHDMAGQVNQLWYPSGTKVEVQRNVITLIAPDEWTYLGRQNDGTILKLSPGAAIRVSCDCTSSGNCSPFYLDGQVGCSTTDCSECSMTVSGQKESNFVDLSEGVYQKLSEPVRFAKEGESLPQAKGLMYESEETLAKLKEFLRNAYGTKVLPELVRDADGSWAPPTGYAIVGINWCGRSVIFPVPDAPGLPGGGGGKASCDCSNGTCTLQSQWVPGHGTGYSCQGDCSGTCTLTVKMISGGGTLYSFIAYRF